MEFEWESILLKSSATTMRAKRAKVFGGWMVTHVTWENETVSESSIFVPDPNHEWKISKE